MIAASTNRCLNVLVKLMYKQNNKNIEKMGAMWRLKTF